MQYLRFLSFGLLQRGGRSFGFGEPPERGIFLLVTHKEHRPAAAATTKGYLCNNAVLLYIFFLTTFAYAGLS